MKYIDAEKLKEQIQFLIDSGYDKLQGSLYHVLSIIDSLQQEQPEGLHFIPLIRLIQKISSKNWNNTVNNYAKKLRDCLIKEGYLKDAEVLQGYISYMNGNNVPMATMDEQEQPEEDLKEEIMKWQGYEAFPEGTNITPLPKAMDIVERTARHFYELGLNARKEK